MYSSKHSMNIRAINYVDSLILYIHLQWCQIIGRIKILHIQPRVVKITMNFLFINFMKKTGHLKWLNKNVSVQCVYGIKYVKASVLLWHNVTIYACYIAIINEACTIKWFHGWIKVSLTCLSYWNRWYLHAIRMRNPKPHSDM